MRSRLLYAAPAIEEAVAKIGKEISKDYKDKTPILIGALSGSYIFMADLTRAISTQIEVGFVQVRSYVDNVKVSTPIITGGPMDVEGRDIILVDDLCETGETLKHLEEMYLALGAKSVKTCTLIIRPNSPLKVDYYGFMIGKQHWIIGYGMDDSKLSRNLPHIYSLIQNEETDC